MNRRPYYVCRRCDPYIFLFTYDELRKHLRIHHQIRELDQYELRLYEVYPDANYDARQKGRERSGKKQIKSLCGGGTPSGGKNVER